MRSADMVAWVAAVMAVTMLATPAMAGCPTGSYPWVDSWGNEICRAFGSGNTVTISPPAGGGCPYGTFPTRDSWGTAICKEFGRSGQSYYDTSRGCPAGTFQTIDSWGNPACKSF